jgi:alkanesulfonate monooxygenase SsuD/methylene tetrahydromethanopterin reductase-like flavin-dependent oxidoreductase (luciferase family)
MEHSQLPVYMKKRAPMKFGLFSHIPWPEGMDQKRIIEETTEQVQYGEELGFCGAWFAEHHFSRYGLGSSSLILLSSIAAQTTTIRLGTAILVPPLHHPIRLAEDTAMLDLVSGGRLDVGFGRGSANYEYGGYNVDREESQGRFQETVRIVQNLWTTPEYTYEGQYCRINQVTLVPSPVQEPHPPLYIAATRTPATLEFVVSTGHPLIIGVVLDTQDALDLCRRFVIMSEASGHHVPMSRIPFSRYFYVAETTEQARKDTQESLEWTLDMIQWRRSIASGSEVGRQLADWRKTRSELPPSYDYLCAHRAIIGTPASCITKLKVLQEQGVDYFICNFAFGGMDHQKILRSMQLFAREVMPYFR